MYLITLPYDTLLCAAVVYAQHVIAKATTGLYGYGHK